LPLNDTVIKDENATSAEPKTKMQHRPNHYVDHLIEVAELVAGSISEPDTIQVSAALLHDTIEDTATGKDELTARFGSEVADLVAEVTDDKSLPKAERKRLQIETASKKSPRAQNIKLADKISNLRSILHSPAADWDFQRKKEYFSWARQFVDGLTAPNPILKLEFEATLQKFDDVVAEEQLLQPLKIAE
jgi:guanosine-3',5'-bis(diphosphate) 3'-pyrophosphohydrolase